MDTTVKIEYYVRDTIPERILAQLKEGGFEPDEKSLIAVETIIRAPNPEKLPPVYYKAENIGNTPDQLVNYVHRLAREDGIDLKKAFADDKTILPQIPVFRRGIATRHRC